MSGDFLLQVELMDADMVEFGIDLVHELDRAYSLPPKRTMSQVQTFLNTFCPRGVSGSLGRISPLQLQ